MVTYFDEKDMISFGNYLLSPIRRKIYLDQGIAEDRVDDLISTVNPADIKHWFNIILQQKQQLDEEKVQTENTESNEG